MKRTNSFVLFGRAFKNAKNDFWVSIQVLLVATFVLALLFYFVEHTAQPEEYKNPWDAFVWAITRYIGDPSVVPLMFWDEYPILWYHYR